jgi:hypothetical protein
VREALGRARGGYETKAYVITDDAGRAISFALAPGQAHELPLARDLVECLPDVPGWVVCETWAIMRWTPPMGSTSPPPGVACYRSAAAAVRTPPPIRQPAVPSAKAFTCVAATPRAWATLLSVCKRVLTAHSKS